MKRIEAAVGRTLTFDGRLRRAGFGAECNLYEMPLDVPIVSLGLGGHTVLFVPSRLSELRSQVSRLKTCQALRPTDTAGVFVVPSYLTKTKPGQDLLQGMSKAVTFGVGETLFQGLDLQGKPVELPGLESSVSVWYAPPLPVVSSVLALPHASSLFLTANSAAPSVAASITGPLPIVPARVGGLNVSVLADTGASHDFVSKELCAKLGVKLSKSVWPHVTLADGGKQTILGRVTLRVAFGSVFLTLRPFVLPTFTDAAQMIMGAGTMVREGAAVDMGKHALVLRTGKRTVSVPLRTIGVHALTVASVAIDQPTDNYALSAISAMNRDNDAIIAAHLHAASCAVPASSSEDPRRFASDKAGDKTGATPVAHKVTAIKGSSAVGTATPVPALPRLPPTKTPEKVGRKEADRLIRKGAHVLVVRPRWRPHSVSPVASSVGAGSDASAANKKGSNAPASADNTATPQAGTAPALGKEKGTAVPSSSIPPQDPRVKALLDEYAEVFKAIPGLPPVRPVDHTIPLQPGTRPVSRPMYRLSPKELEEVKRQVTDLMSKGMVRPSSSPWSAPILFVGKKDGTLRMCIDYRGLNAVTVKNRYPLPRIDDLLDKLRGARYFSSIDLQQGYNQIRIAPSDIPMTAFRTPFGHYEYTVLSFGLVNAPATFQACIDRMFRPLIDKGVVVCYLDDVLVVSRTLDEHLEHLRAVLETLRREQLYAKLSKCHWAQEQIEYLGHIVSADGVRMDPKKSAAVRNWPVPKNLQELRKFLGLTNYFRKFIERYSILAAPLTNLLKKGAFASASAWTAACQAAFDAIKKAVASDILLAYPDYSQPFRVEVVSDASVHGSGAVLLQNGRPIAFASRKFSGAETRYTTGEQEFLAVLHALKEWRCYLEGHPFTVKTDHKPLTFLDGVPTLNRRQARWMEYLARFDYTWEYLKGSMNVADALSRHPLLQGIFLAMVTRGQARKASGLGTAKPSAGVAPAPKTAKPTPAAAVPAATGPGKQAAAGKQRADAAPAPAPPAKTRRLVSPPAWAAAPPVPAGDPVTGPADSPEVSVSFGDRIRAAYASDPWFSDETNTRALTCEDGLWYRAADGARAIVVPADDSLRRDIISACHSGPLSGHVGTKRTLDIVSRSFWWRGLSVAVDAFVRACDLCQRSKAASGKTAGTLHSLPIPDAPWESVSLDFVTALPKTEGGYDTCCVMVDRLTKMVHLVPTRGLPDSPTTARIFFDNVVRLHGVPRTVISDRGPQFTSKFWDSLCTLIGMRSNLSTAYHPQTDGQTERINRVLGDMLRNYTVGSANTWDSYLTAAEFAINNAVNRSTGFTPFFLNYGYHLATPVWRELNVSAPAAREYAKSYVQRMAEARACLEAAQARAADYYDRNKKDVTYAPGDLVLLNTKNLRARAKGPRKLLPRWIGPFTVVRMVGGAAVQLSLPASLKNIHHTFHVSMVRKYAGTAGGRVRPDAGDGPGPVAWIDDEPLWTVGRILDFRRRAVEIGKGRRRLVREYLVKWKGYSSKHNSWEPEANFTPDMAAALQAARERATRTIED